MKAIFAINIFAIIVLVGVSVVLRDVDSNAAKSQEAVPYPDGFRQWIHVRSGFIGPSSPLFERFGGIHHVYANNKAVHGLKTGSFPDGAVFVADFLEMSINEGDTEMVAEGARRFVDVMYKDADRFADTGGWGFEEFLGNSRSDRPLDERTRAQCFACHQGRKQNGFVFSVFRD